MAQESVQTYCRAQAHINEIDKTSEPARKILAERLKTCRSVVLEELQRSNTRCLEVVQEGSAPPVYLRLKQTYPESVVSLENILAILGKIEPSDMCRQANTKDNDTPRIISDLLQKELRAQRTQNTAPKETLVISETKERGHGVAACTVQASTRQLATDLLTAKQEMKQFLVAQTDKKKKCVTQQKEAEPRVKAALKELDPVTQTSRIHVVQNGQECLYYLRLREQQTAKKVGVRLVLPLVEDAAVHVLQSKGMPREFNADAHPLFWTAFLEEVRLQYDTLAKAKKISSRLSLDRGPARNTTTVP